MISETNMPEMGGVASMRQIQLMYPDVMRMMLSGAGNFGIAMTAINERGVHKFFVKSHDSEMLRSEIKRKSGMRPAMPSRHSAQAPGDQADHRLTARSLPPDRALHSPGKPYY